ncbi:hypothetical protein DKM19_29970 [Streptosporangium sp. 'caverna']|nr:hypothetical protein DKM19_29970 [Streptosporangium sp. 'caverna']
MILARSPRRAGVILARSLSSVRRVGVVLARSLRRAGVVLAHSSSSVLAFGSAVGPRTGPVTGSLRARRPAAFRH